jgi:hypothetical protein
METDISRVESGYGLWLQSTAGGILGYAIKNH